MGEAAVLAVILAGGVGKRAWPLTATRPKPLLPLPGGRSILGRLVEQARRVAKEVVVVAPPGGGSVIREALEREGFGGVRVVEQRRYEEGGYGSGAALAAVADLLPDDLVLIVNGDSVLHDSVFERLASAGGPAIAALHMCVEGGRYGVVVSRGDRLEEIIEKPEEGGCLDVNVGVYLLPGGLLRSALDRLRPSPRGELELTDAVNMVASETPVRVVRLEGRVWRDVGTWWDFLLASRMVLDWLVARGCRAEGLVDERAVVKGPVCGEGFEIGAYSVVEGPVWLGRGVEVGPFTHIRGYTVVHEGSSLGAYVEVKASVLLEHVTARHHSYIGDSVVAEGVNIAAGTITANLRHDGRSVRSCSGGRVVDTGLRKLGAVIGAYTKTGINTSISPGTRIGPCVWIEEGAVVRHDIPGCMLVKRDGSLVDASRFNRECCERIRERGVGLCA